MIDIYWVTYYFISYIYISYYISRIAAYLFRAKSLEQGIFLQNKTWHALREVVFGAKNRKKVIYDYI